MRFHQVGGRRLQAGWGDL